MKIHQLYTKFKLVLTINHETYTHILFVLNQHTSQFYKNMIFLVFTYTHFDIHSTFNDDFVVERGYMFKYIALNAVLNSIQMHYNPITI